MIDVMDAWYDAQIELDPAVPLEEATKALPGRWAVYLMCDADGRPVQLLSVKNLRASVRRRLSDSPADVVSKRVDYRGLVRHVFWRRVDSALESDLVYLAAARAVFPDTFRKIIPLRQAWFVHIDPLADFPRWTRTDDATTDRGILFGPMLEKSHANKLIEKIEDLFDLCRYHNILTQSPHGVACAYKDMGKCPAPCDGSVSMQQYRALIDWSLRTLTDPQQEIEEQEQRMQDAAREMRFELAGKIKQFVAGLASLRKGHFSFARPVEDFRFLSLQPGPFKGQAKIFAVTPGAIECVACLRGEPKELLLRLSQAQALKQPQQGRLTPDQAETLRLAARHLMAAKPSGVFIHGDDLDDRTLAAAYKQLLKQAKPVPEDEESEDEGVVAELLP